MNRWRICSRTAVSSDGQGAKQKSRTNTGEDLVSPRSLLRPTRTRESTPANANNSVLAKYQWRSLMIFRTEVGSNVYQPRRTIRGASEILKMNPMVRFFLFLTLKLASNQLHTSSSNWCQGNHSNLKGTLIEFLSKIILTVTTSVPWRLKISRSIFTTAMRKCTIITLPDDSNLNAFQTFWPRLNILRLADVPSIIVDRNFPSTHLRSSFSNFSFN